MIAPTFCLLALCCLTATIASEPPTIKFQRIVGTETPVPGGSGNFVDFWESAIDKGNVVFGGRDADSGFVLFLWNGKLQRIVDQSTESPERRIPFTDVHGPAIGGSFISFLGVDDPSPNNRIRGWYRLSLGGELIEVANDREFTPFPSGAGWLVVDGNGDGVFQTQGAGCGNNGCQEIHYYRDGEIGTIVKTGMPIPGGGTFDVLVNDVVYDEGNLAFRSISKSGDWGVYKILDDGVIRAVANTGMPIPGQPEKTFSGFDQIANDGESVAFSADDGSVQTVGIYSDFGGLHRVADTTMMGADGRLFRGASDPLIHNDVVVFTAVSRVVGLYGSVKRGEPFPILIARETELDGKVVREFDYQSEGMDNGQMAIEITFMDWSRGLYIIDIDGGSSNETDSKLPQISSIGISDGMVTLHWEPFGSGGSYFVESSQDLSTWKQVKVVEGATKFQTPATDSVIYYRVSTP